MAGSARDARAARAVLTRSAEGFTGRLSVGPSDNPLSVHLLRGDLIGATRDDDVARVVRLLHARGVLTTQESDFFQRHIEQGESVLGEVLDVADGALLDAVLRDRFIQNVADFVTTDEEPRVEVQRSVFVENVQMGHDTEALVLATCRDHDVAALLELDQHVMRGDAEPGRGVSVGLLVATLHTQPRPVRAILEEVPLEPLRARRLLVELIEAGVAEESTETGPEPRVLDDENSAELASDDQPADTPDPELAAFDDHDWVRGGAGAGTFTTEDHHRDVVEVVGLDAPTEPVLRLAGPQVAEDQVRHKVEVANDVLRKVSAALDEQQGRGRGKSAVQLLVSGSPPRYAALTRDVPVADDGSVSEPMLLMNLRKRPAAEQHQLLHQALLDMIERSLSVAADSLGEHALDVLFDSVAGYRSRMGR